MKSKPVSVHQRMPLERAIDIVDRALVKHGAPVFVRHEIVHNCMWWKGCATRAPDSSMSWMKCPRTR